MRPFCAVCGGSLRGAGAVVLSGGCSWDTAEDRLVRDPGRIAPFSRALPTGLTAQQSDEDSDRTLDASIEAVCRVSNSWPGVMRGS